MRRRNVQAVNGIDFSGAQDAGNKIWIAKGVPDGERLVIQECFRAGEFLNSGEELLPNLAALRDMVTSNRNAAFGFDFPFGLPRTLVPQNCWEDFVLEFPTRFNDHDDFKEKCCSEAGDRELRRQTDIEVFTSTSFLPPVEAMPLARAAFTHTIGLLTI